MSTFKNYYLQIINEEGLLNKVGRKLKISTTKGKPNIEDAPSWALYLGQTPEGAYHWLSNITPVETTNSNIYFPNAKKTEFTGFVGMKGAGSVVKIK